MFATLQSVLNDKFPGTMSNSETTLQLQQVFAGVCRSYPPSMMEDPHTQKAILRASFEAMREWINKSRSGGDPLLFEGGGHVQQKDVLQPQEDVVKYREVEYNLIINSGDRDWLNNTRENRYNFRTMLNAKQSGPSVSVTGAFNGQGYGGLQTAIQARLRNIVRLEFIKAILPVESLSVIVPRDCSHNTLVTTAFDSVLALPSVNVIVDEFQGNNYGTNQEIDRSLAVCQYDSVWRSDFHHYPTTSRGNALFIPKFMKAQRIYTPTPLANLTSLSFRIQNTENNLLSTLPDSSSIAEIAFSSDVSGSCYSDTSGEYIFINTASWFPIWSYSILDKLAFQGLAFQGATFAGAADLTAWLQDPTISHAVVGTAYTHTSGQPYTVTDGANTAGYANWIIIRSRFADPTDGSTSVLPFSGTPTEVMTGAVLNLNRQVQIYLRVITREYDLTTNVRADNV